MPRSALIAAIPEAEPLVGEWRLRYDNASLGIPAHVTLLFPFIPAGDLDEASLGELRGLVSTQGSFSVAFTRIARFPEVAWLAPEPAEPFRRLTELIVERYPDYPPYEGIHDEVIPHLTVAVGPAELQDRVEAAVGPNLPITAEVREVASSRSSPTGIGMRAKAFRSEGVRMRGLEPPRGFYECGRSWRTVAGAGVSRCCVGPEGG